jgi:uncharacterized membrane-anchored protein YhcB (DUF1043 family)
MLISLRSLATAVLGKTRNVKSEEEVQKHVRETAELIGETTDIFKKSLSIYLSRVAEQLRAMVEKAENGKITAEGQKQLAVVSEEMTALSKMIARHKGIISRVMKVTIHKNEAKSYERMDAALDRMKKESDVYREKLRQLATKK